jgi:hypothetical protein
MQFERFYYGGGSIARGSSSCITKSVIDQIPPSSISTIEPSPAIRQMWRFAA